MPSFCLLSRATAQVRWSLGPDKSTCPREERYPLAAACLKLCRDPSASLVWEISLNMDKSQVAFVWIQERTRRERQAAITLSILIFFCRHHFPAQLSQMYSLKVSRCQICTNLKAWGIYPLTPQGGWLLSLTRSGDTDLLPRRYYLEWESNFCGCVYVKGGMVSVSLRRWGLGVYLGREVEWRKPGLLADWKNFEKRLLSRCLRERVCIWNAICIHFETKQKENFQTGGWTVVDISQPTNQLINR